MASPRVTRASPTTDGVTIHASAVAGSRLRNISRTNPYSCEHNAADDRSRRVREDLALEV